MAESIINNQQANVQQFITPLGIDLESTPSLPPYSGSLAYDNSAKILYVADGTEWNQVATESPTGPTGDIAYTNVANIFTAIQDFTQTVVFGTGGATATNILAYNNKLVYVQGGVNGLQLEAASVSGVQTLTLPAVTDQVVARATMDTLQNKTLWSPAIITPTITGTGTAFMSAIHDSIYYGNSATPGITAGTGAGTGSSVFISGTDSCGYLTVTILNTGGTGTNGLLATITMHNTPTTQPLPIVSLSGNSLGYVSAMPTVGAQYNGTQNQWNLVNIGTVPIPPGVYLWFYWVPCI